MAKTKTKKPKTGEKKKIAGAEDKNMCSDIDCPTHGNLRARGRIFKGVVVSKLPRRVAIEFERMTYFRKFERYAKMKTKIHARLPKCMEKDIEKGDLIRIQECRPLSKIIHFVVIGKIKSSEEENKEKKGK